MNTREEMFELNDMANIARKKGRRAKSSSRKRCYYSEAEFYESIVDDLQELLVLRQHEEERKAI